MKRAMNLPLSKRRKWHRVQIPNSWEAAHATRWAAELPSTGQFYLITRPDFNNAKIILDMFYFSQKKDALLFTLKWC